MSKRDDLGTTVLFLDTTPFFGPLMQVHGRLMKHLDPSRFRIVLAAFGHNNYAGLLAEAPHVELLDCRPRSLAFGGGRWARGTERLLHPFARLRGLLRVAGDARKQHVAIVHVGMTVEMLVAGSLISLISGARLVVHVHADPLRTAGVRRTIYKMGMHYAAAVITVSAFVKRQVSALGVRSEKIWPVLNTVDLERFHPDNNGSQIRREYGIPGGVPLVVCLGRLFPGKGQHHLIRAMAHIPIQDAEARTLIVGWDETRGNWGNYRRLLHSLVEELGLQGRVFIDKARPESQAIMAAADIVAVPSTHDPCPLTVLEAMASGKPLVGFNSGGIPEEVGTDGRALVEAGNEESLAQALLTFVRDEELRRAEGERNRRRAEANFYEARLAEEVTEIYRNVLSGSATAVPSGTHP